MINFGPPDNFWCYNFERAVGRYISISTNFKNIEITFARAELRREVLKVRSSLKAQGNSSAETVSYPKEAHYGSLAELENAKQHFSDGANHLAKINGILVGASKPVHLFEEVQRNSILAQFGQDQGITGESLSDVAQECRSIYFTSVNGNKGMLYRVGENIIVSVEDGDECVLTITQLLRTNVSHEYHLFVVGDCFQAVIYNSEKQLHQWSKGALVRPSSTEKIVHSSKIQQKVMLFPDPENLNDLSIYICIDFQRQCFPLSSVIVPCYPEVGDMLLIKGDDPDPWRAVVLAVQERTQYTPSSLG